MIVSRAEPEPEPVPEPEPEPVARDLDHELEDTWPERAAEPEPEAAAEPERAPEPEPADALPRLEPLGRRPKRRWFRRTVEEEPEPERPPPPKHVRLLPVTPRTDADDEVAELFDERKEQAP